MALTGTCYRLMKTVMDFERVRDYSCIQLYVNWNDPCTFICPRSKTACFCGNRLPPTHVRRTECFDYDERVNWSSKYCCNLRFVCCGVRTFALNARRFDAQCDFWYRTHMVASILLRASLSVQIEALVVVHERNIERLYERHSSCLSVPANSRHSQINAKQKHLY